MSKNEELKDLFSDVFVVNQEINKDYWGRDIDKFCCNCIDSCGYNRNETKRTCGIGDEKSSVLIIGEAPSSSGDGEKTSIPFSNLPIKGKSPQYKIRDFIVEKYNGLVPFFTDFIKCGLINQNDKTPLKNRKVNCVSKFLLHEIAIIYPDQIITCHSSVHKYLRKNKKQIEELLNLTLQCYKKNKKTISVIYLWHYTAYGKGFRQNPFKKWNEQLKTKNQEFKFFVNSE